MLDEGGGKSFRWSPSDPLDTMILHEKHKLTLTCYKKFVHAFLNKGVINSNPTEEER